MGREIRMVPPNWEHPQRDPENDPYRHGGYQPTYDRHFDDVFSEWLADFDRVRGGELKDFEAECYPNGLSDWLVDDGAPPNRAYYRTYRDEDATWFQIYETVSEGTPVTPPFATKAELVDYLAANGDFWDQKRGVGQWQRENAERFVGTGWAPSMVAVVGGANAGVYTARDLPERSKP